MQWDFFYSTPLKTIKPFPEQQLGVSQNSVKCHVSQFPWELMEFHLTSLLHVFSFTPGAYF